VGLLKEGRMLREGTVSKGDTAKDKAESGSKEK
jgi:hypothetical protein